MKGEDTEYCVCEACGVLVADKQAHKHWHETIREAVDSFMTSIDSLEEAMKVLLKIIS